MGGTEQRVTIQQKKKKRGEKTPKIHPLRHRRKRLEGSSRSIVGQGKRKNERKHRKKGGKTFLPKRRGGELVSGEGGLRRPWYRGKNKGMVPVFKGGKMCWVCAGVGKK